MNLYLVSFPAKTKVVETDSRAIGSRLVKVFNRDLESRGIMTLFSITTSRLVQKPKSDQYVDSLNIN